jgi:hypothetical protein
VSRSPNPGVAMAAVVAWAASAPRYVWGAAPSGRRQQTALTFAHETAC